MKLFSEAQERVLLAAKRDGFIVIGGPNATPGVRFDVCRRLCAQGLLRWVANADPYARAEFVLTDSGRAANVL